MCHARYVCLCLCVCVFVCLTYIINFKTFFFGISNHFYRFLVRFWSIGMRHFFHLRIFVGHQFRLYPGLTHSGQGFSIRRQTCNTLIWETVLFFFAAEWPANWEKKLDHFKWWPLVEGRFFFITSPLQRPPPTTSSPGFFLFSDFIRSYPTLPLWRGSI